MSFTPLPPTFIDDLERQSGLGVLELGSGDGVLTEVLRRHGVQPVTLDRRPAAVGCQAAVCGDALRPPFAHGFGLVVAGNLLRHLWSGLEPAGPAAWRDLVAPGGALWILEDEPAAAPASARHYRDLHGLLARLHPDGRGPLLSQRRFQAHRRRWNWPGVWLEGIQENRWPAKAEQIIDWLAAGVPVTDGEVSRLIEAIRTDGLSYGNFWWARWQAEAEA
jgi:hypothetical protein